MKRAWLYGIILSGIVNIGISQEITNHLQKDIILETIQKPNSSQLRTICGNEIFKDDIKKITDYISEHPEYRQLRKRLQKPETFEVGDTKEWWTYNRNSESYELVNAECKAKGEHCYIFVSNDSWANGEIIPSQINELVEAFDNSTPAFSNIGIYEKDVDIFGTPPDMDGDDRIIILVFDIKDEYETTGTYVAGYFNPNDQYTDGSPEIGSARSNEADMFYIDTHPLLDIVGIDEANNTLAHEFQHMIHHEHDEGEMTFVNEGLSEIASYICGYGLRSNGRYTQNTNVNLLSWDGTGDVLEDYSRASFWTLYILEQFPIGILKDFVNNHHSYWGDFDITFKAHDVSRGFFEVFEEWLIANYVNGNSADAKYIYQYSPLSKPDPVATYIGNPNGIGNGTLVPYGAEYIKFSGGSDLTITFATDNSIKIKALKIGSLEIEDVTKGVPYTPTGFGTTFPEVTFLVYNQSLSNKNYSYVSTGTAVAGTMELFYEDGEPDGYAPPGTWANPGDSVAVKFDGITGGKLDSIRIAFRRNGTIQMDISEFDGGTFLRGNNLYGPVQVVSTDSTTVVNSSYPIPFDNWVTVDLTNQNIETSKNFVVSLLLGNNTSEPGIMVSAESTSGHSFWYATTDNTWHTYTAEGGKIWNYFIRAYVSIGGTTVLAQPTINSIVANQGNIQLSWNSSAGPVEGYNIYRSTSTGFTPDNNNKIGNVGSTIINYTDAWPNIQPNTDYYYRISSFDGSGNESDYSEEVTTRTLDVNDKNGIPTEYSLNSNYPNPFNPSTTFRFTTPEDGLVKFTVHDLLGRVVYSDNRNLLAGNYSFTWEGNNMLNQQVVSGVYFLRMEAEGFIQTRKMLMMK